MSASQLQCVGCKSGACMGSAGVGVCRRGTSGGWATHRTGEKKVDSPIQTPIKCMSSPLCCACVADMDLHSVVWIALPPETHKTRVRPHHGHMASSTGTAKWASLCHVHLASGAGNDTQVQRKAWTRRQTPEELTLRARLEKRKGVARPHVPSSLVTV